MEKTSKVYRIRTKVGEDAPNVIYVPLNQTYDMFEILSLKIDQTNTYKTYQSDYGIIVGRVTANGGFGIPNAKVSVFISVSDEETWKDKLLYNFTSTSSTDNKGIRYNLLPDYIDDECHQNVGTFPNKRLVLDNNDIVEMFDTYWKYTTVTNNSGDYFIFGVPVGSQTVHCDVDLSDCGILSQRPRDMIYKGYNEQMFESPNKFRTSTNLNSLVQIVSQDKSVYVYPYWGDISDGDDQFAITRCDINVEYKFEPTAIFMGSIVTDKGSNAIGKNCTGSEHNGKMSDLISGEGTIEMIRKTVDNKVEEFPIKGNRLIDSDGVWCYQIPMNLDYVVTDEFGNIVPTDNPEKGIPTRTRVRFRISLDENPNDATARKRARYLVPNNPRMEDSEFEQELEADYEFGSATREESYCDLFWNKVYTVKNYIPKLQKNTKETNRKHTGIKLINHYGDNNPMPYNALTIKLSFTYRIICVITKIIINLIEFLNEIISLIGAILCLIIKIIELPANLFDKIANIGCFKVLKVKICPLKYVAKPLANLWRTLTKGLINIIYSIMPYCIGLSSEFCDDGINQMTYYPGCGYFFFRLFSFDSIGLDCVWKKTAQDHNDNEKKICENEGKSPEECETTLTIPNNKTAMLYNCVENQLAQQNDATSFNFNNDWINGVLYAPLWYRKIRPKRSYFFGLFKKKAKDEWCSANQSFPTTRILEQCVLRRKSDKRTTNFDNENIQFRYVDESNICDGKCHTKYRDIKGLKGIILPKTTMLNQTVYYYKAVEYDASLPRNYTIVNNNVNKYISDKNGEVKLLFATDIVLLGSLNECDLHGIPQFFKTLESTTYNMPSDILFTDYDFIMTVDEDGKTGRQEITVTDVVLTSEMAGCDWGNPNEFSKYDGGLFYSIGCSSGSIKLDTKSCINLKRICEYGVSLDETKEIADLEELAGATDEEIDNNDKYFQKLITDGFVSWDELYNLDERSMFATMNGNRLKTKLNTKNGLKEYDFRYLYPENFDGSLREVMKERTKKYSTDINYRNNWKLENASRDYYMFRMGNHPYFYDMDKGEEGYAFPRYENSFYFYFGLKAGKTAIEKFNSKYFAECNNPDSTSAQINYKYLVNSWCSQVLYKLDGTHEITQEDVDNNFTWFNENGEENIAETNQIGQTVQVYKIVNDGYLALDFSNIQTPYDLLINGVSNGNFSVLINGITEEKIIFIKDLNNRPNKLDDYIQLKGILKDKEIYEYDSSGEVIEMLDNGSYQGSITDASGNITEFTFKINGKYLSYKINAQSFEQPNNVLMELFNNNLKSIASDKTGIIDTDNQNINREIGGVVTIYDLFMDASILDFYTIEIRPKSNIGYQGFGILYKQGQIYYYDFNNDTWVLINNVTNYEDLIYYDSNHHYAFGVPKGDCEYTITITQRCEDGSDFGIDNGNVITKDVFISGPKPYKMFINGIDYDLLKNFDDNTGWNLTGNLTNPTANPISYDGVLDMDNPWFKFDNVFYEKLNIEVYVNVNDNTDVITKKEYEELDVQDQQNYESQMIELDLNNVVEFIVKKPDVVEYYTYYNINDANDEKSEFEYNLLSESEKNLYTKKIISEEEYYSFNDERRKKYQEICTIYAVTENGEEYEVLEKDLIKEFCENRNDTDVPYNWVDDYIVEDYENIDNFIALVNNALTLRKELPYNMKEVFYMSCIDEDKDIYITAHTDKLPYTQTIVYHPEITDEQTNTNVLDGNNLITEDKGSVNDIMIPTISYRSSIYFGDGSTNDDSPCLAEINGLKKKPYSVAVMNKSGVSIPKDQNNKPFVSYEKNGAKYIDYNTTQHNDLFSFPIIDKILIVDYIAWSAFVDIPKYGYYVNENNETVPYKDAITMNGLLAGLVYNGNITNNKFVEQTLNSLELNLSENINANNPQTYVEKRLINGYDYNVMGNRILNLLNKYVNTFITKEIIDKFNEIFSYELVDTSAEITDEIKEQFKQIISSLRFSNNKIIYEGDNINFEVDVEHVLSYVLNFTDYKVIEEVEGNTQYAFVLPMETTLSLQDKNGCGILQTINGDMTVDLSEEAVNNCKTNVKILKVENEEGAYYSIFKVGNNYNYPLNKATKENIFLWQINDRIDNVYDTTNTQNLFSFQMKTDYLRGKDDLVDKNFTSQVLVSYDEDGNEEYEDTRGYGTTGSFEYSPLIPFNRFNYPIFIVAETENHCRALSPVYDYSYVEANIKFGLYKRKEVIEQTDPNTGVTTYVPEESEDYKFGVSYNNLRNKHYYLDNYDYSLSCISKIDNVNTIEITEQLLSSPNQYIFTSISKAMYLTLYVKVNGGLGVFVNNLIKNTTITAIDYSGLRHICDINRDNFEDTTWYTVIWRGNLPLQEGEQPGEDTCGIKVDDEYLSEVEDIYEVNDTFIVRQMHHANGFNWIGWSENEPNGNIVSTFPPRVTESKVYYGNWSVEVVNYNVNFVDSDGTTPLYSITVQSGNTISPPSSNPNLQEYGWYILGDNSKTEVAFPYCVVGDVTFVKLREFTVNWTKEMFDVHFLNENNEELPEE